MCCYVFILVNDDHELFEIAVNCVPALCPLGTAEVSLYQVKHEMLDDFLRRELKNPSVPMRFA